MSPSPSRPRSRRNPPAARSHLSLVPTPFTIVALVAALAWVWPVMQYRLIGGLRGIALAALACGIEVICAAFVLFCLTRGRGTKATAGQALTYREVLSLTTRTTSRRDYAERHS